MGPCLDGKGCHVAAANQGHNLPIFAAQSRLSGLLWYRNGEKTTCVFLIDIVSLSQLAQASRLRLLRFDKRNRLFGTCKKQAQARTFLL